MLSCSSDDSPPTFTPQNLLQYPKKEVCTFDNAYLSALCSSGIFQDGIVFRPYDQDLRSDASSREWLCFLAFPFTLGLRFPLSDFIMDFFRTTGLSFSQTMPMLWQVLVVLDRIKNTHVPKLYVNDLPIVYRLRSHGSSRFLFYSTTNNPLVLRATRNKEIWETKFFFVKRSLIPCGENFLVEWLTKAPPLVDSAKRIEAIYKLQEIKRSCVPSQATSRQHSSSNMSDTNKMPVFRDLDELDSYSIPVSVKKETPTTTSSKPFAAPKPTPQPRIQASGSKKRKGSETATAAPEGFSFEDLSFTDSFEPMTSFLHKGLQHLLNLYTESYEALKVLEARKKEGRDHHLGPGKDRRHQDPILRGQTEEGHLGCLSDAGRCSG
ncbi:hypothetical protein Hanom_Chr02g00121461 [Helianthus anomalus]